jgi:hypothetical protein
VRIRELNGSVEVREMNSSICNGACSNGASSRRVGASLISIIRRHSVTPGIIGTLNVGRKENGHA